jgi:hypothetical protein
MKQGLTAVVLSLVVPTIMAANPASTAYVDTKNLLVFKRKLIH